MPSKKTKMMTMKHSLTLKTSSLTSRSLMTQGKSQRIIQMMKQTILKSLMSPKMIQTTILMMSPKTILMMNLTRTRNNEEGLCNPFVIFILTLFFRAMFVSETPYFNEDSAYYNLRHTDYISQNIQPMIYDDLSYGGRYVIDSHIFHLVLAGFQELPA